MADQTVGNILRRHGIEPAPKRSQNTTWREFIESDMAVLAGIDFFTVEVLTWRGLVTYYVLFFIHLESRRVSLAGITRHPARPGWSRWRATQRPRVGVTWSAGAMRCTIAIRSSAPRFGRHWRWVESERTDYWRAAPQIVRNGKSEMRLLTATLTNNGTRSELHSCRCRLEASVSGKLSRSARQRRARA